MATEEQAIQVAYDATTDSGATARLAFRQGWIEGRDWQRAQTDAIAEAARAYRDRCAITFVEDIDWGAMEEARAALFALLDSAARPTEGQG